MAFESIDVQTSVQIIFIKTLQYKLFYYLLKIYI